MLSAVIGKKRRCARGMRSRSLGVWLKRESMGKRRDESRSRVEWLLGCVQCVHARLGRLHQSQLEEVEEGSKNLRVALPPPFISFLPSSRARDMLRRLYPPLIASGMGIAIGYYTFNEPLREAAELAAVERAAQAAARRGRGGDGDDAAEQQQEAEDEPEWRRARRRREQEQREAGVAAAGRQQQERPEAAAAASSPRRRPDDDKRAQER